jgi:choice-of-anchor C domain-containing protein
MRITLFVILISLFAISCKDLGPTTDDPGSQASFLGKMSLQFVNPPPEITRVVARLSRPNFQERVLTLPISGSTASGTFQDVPIGVWHLRVDAQDSANVVRYSGETDVNVLASETTHVSLQLLPTGTGGTIQIVVTWGTPPVNATLVNGSFEVGPPVGTYLQLNPGSTALNGWIVTRGQIDIVRFWQASNGERSIDLDGTPGRGGVKQSIRTLRGSTYQVRFAMAGNPEGPPTVKTMAVAAAGLSREFTFDVTGKTIRNMGWQTKTWTFTAIDSVTMVEFYSLDAQPGLYGPALDDVSVVRVQ